MKLIVGLGNPGRKYELTRHNVGFMAAAKIAALIGASPSKSRFDGEVAEGTLGEKVVILWPQTYMNASGKSVRKAHDFYKLSPDDLIVICDDLNLPVGRLRIRPSGSAGGQKGLADIIRHLGTDTFPRLRIGIDRPPQGWEAPDYVLGKFAKEEKDKIDSSTDRAARAALDWVKHGTTFAMNRYNADPSAEKKTTEKKTNPKTTKPDNDRPRGEPKGTSDSTADNSTHPNQDI